MTGQDYTKVDGPERKDKRKYIQNVEYDTLADGVAGRSLWINLLDFTVGICGHASRITKDMSRREMQDVANVGDKLWWEIWPYAVTDTIDPETMVTNKAALTDQWGETERFYEDIRRRPLTPHPMAIRCYIPNNTSMQNTKVKRLLTKYYIRILYKE